MSWNIQVYPSQKNCRETWQHGPAAKPPQNGQGLIVIGDYLGLPYLIYWPIRRLDHIARYLLVFNRTNMKQITE